MIMNLLASKTTTYVILGVLLLLMIAFFVYNMFTNKKRAAQREETVNKMLKVGNEILTIGGIKGEIVEVFDDGSFVLKTGSEENSSFMKFDKAAFHSVVNQSVESETQTEVYSDDFAENKEEDVKEISDENVVDEPVETTQDKEETDK